MSYLPIVISLAGVVWVTVAIVTYFKKVLQIKVPPNITGLVINMIIGVGLAGSAIALSIQRGSTGAAVIVPAALAMMLAFMM